MDIKFVIHYTNNTNWIDCVELPLDKNKALASDVVDALDARLRAECPENMKFIDRVVIDEHGPFWATAYYIDGVFQAWD